MPRVSEKMRKERRDNLVRVAERLFLQNGYENTTIDLIIDELNFAKGTFYYHFRSKEEILIAVCEKLVSGLEIQLRKLRELKDLSVYEKMEAALQIVYGTFYDNRDIWLYIYRENNIIMHGTLMKITMKTLSPWLASIIEEGIKKKQFNALHPQETAEVVLAMVDLHVKQYRDAIVEQDVERSRDNMEKIFGYILGVEQYHFARP